MKERIKILSISTKKMKLEEAKNWQNLIEKFAPDMYDTIEAVGEEETIKQVVKYRPEIILLNDKVKDALNLLKKIKQMHPLSAVFILINMVDEEQEMIDEYTASGAYKCYLSPLMIESLIHDMYVALNLE